MSVTSIKQDHVNKSALEVLEECIARVKSGEVVAVSIAEITKDMGISGDSSAGPNAFLMWSSLQHCTNEHYRNVILGEDHE